MNNSFGVLCFFVLIGFSMTISASYPSQKNGLQGAAANVFVPREDLEDFTPHQTYLGGADLHNEGIRRYSTESLQGVIIEPKALFCEGFCVAMEEISFEDANVSIENIASADKQKQEAVAAGISKKNKTGLATEKAFVENDFFEKISYNTEAFSKENQGEIAFSEESAESISQQSSQKHPNRIALPQCPNHVGFVATEKAGK
jgi:hypothetical protein